jgi:hypothetical protein
MKTLKKFIKIAYDKNTEEDWDTVWIIAGKEGGSKSTLALHCLDEWYTLLNGKITEKDIRHMCINAKMFVEDLSDLKQYEMTVYDEAAELSNRRFMSEFNHRISQAYMMIRGYNLFTILVLPSLFDIDPYFSKHRVKGFINIYRRGRFDFFTGGQVKALIEIAARTGIKKYSHIPPTYSHGSFGRYHGILLEHYSKMKMEKMSEVKVALKEGAGMKKKESEKHIIINKYAEKHGTTEAAKFFEIHPGSVSRIKKQIKELTTNT